MKRAIYSFISVFVVFLFSFLMDNRNFVEAEDQSYNYSEMLKSNDEFRKSKIEEVASNINSFSKITVVVMDTEETRTAKIGMEVNLQEFIKGNTPDNVNVTFTKIKENGSLSDDIKALKNVIASKSADNNIKLVVLNRKTTYQSFWYCGLFGGWRWESVLKQAYDKGILVVIPSGYYPSSKWWRGPDLHCLTKNDKAVVVSAAKLSEQRLIHESVGDANSVDFSTVPRYLFAKDPEFLNKTSAASAINYVLYDAGGNLDYGIAAASMASDIAIMYTFFPDVGASEMSENLTYEFAINQNGRHSKKTYTKYYSESKTINLVDLYENLKYKKISVNVKKEKHLDNVKLTVYYPKDSDPYKETTISSFMKTGISREEAENHYNILAEFNGGYIQYSEDLKLNDNQYFIMGTRIIMHIYPNSSYAIKWITVNGNKKVGKGGKGDAFHIEITPENGLIGPIDIETKTQWKLFN